MCSKLGHQNGRSERHGRLWVYHSTPVAVDCRNGQCCNSLIFVGLLSRRPFAM